MNDNIIDLEIAKNVFMGDEELYKRYLIQFVQRDLYGKIQELLDENKIEEAFETAHTMKGLVQNLALSELGVALGEVVESLRNGAIPSDTQSNELKEKYGKALEYINYVNENNISIFS